MELREFLTRLHIDRGPNASGEYMCRCPAHDDKSASLCVKEGAKGIVLKCQAGCDTATVLKAMGLAMKDLFYGSSSPAKKENATPEQGKPDAPKEKKKARDQFVCAYCYTDEAGALLYEVCRYLREDGKKTFKIRQPDGEGFYRWTRDGARMVLYRLPEVLSAIAAKEPVLVVEGEKDADTLHQLGYAATTNAMGAGKWESSYSETLKDAQVIIIPDNDDAGAAHARTVAASLYKLGNRPRVADLTKVYPALPPKGDASDLLAAMGGREGAETIRAAIAAAVEWVPDTLVQRDEAAAYYANVPGYCVNEGRICAMSGDGVKPLANFVVLPRMVITRDDGANITQETVLDGWTQDGVPLERVNVRTEQFDSMTWVTKSWDFRANVTPGNTVKDKLRFVISEVGRVTCERVTQYAHTGWRRIHGKWAYLYEGGAIGADDVTVSLGSGLENYRLDGSGSAVYKTLRKTDGARATMEILDVIPHRIAIPLLGTVFLAPLREFLRVTGSDPAYVLFLLGGTGCRKSTVAALALSHFGNFNSRKLPASFNDTANYIRKKAFLLKDMPIVVDDYHPVSSLTERKKMEATAQGLARAFGDLAERGRLQVDLSLQVSMPPRGVAIISGEDTPAIGESGLGRFFVTEIGREDIPATDELTALQEKARNGYLQKCMHGYIEWLIKQADALPKVLQEEFLNNRRKAEKALSGKGAHARSPEAIAQIMLGYSQMMRYFRDLGVFDTNTALTYLEEAWETVTETAIRQSMEQTSGRPTRIFLEAVGELLQSKRACVRDLTSDKVRTYAPNDNLIGYMDERFYYLIPNTAYDVVCRLLAGQNGQTFPLTMRMLYKQLREDGMLSRMTCDEGNVTKVKKIDGKAVRLLWLSRGLIDGPEVEAEQMEIDGKSYAVSDEPIPF